MALREISRVLKPGGVFIFSAHNTRALPKRLSLTRHFTLHPMDLLRGLRSWVQLNHIYNSPAKIKRALAAPFLPTRGGGRLVELIYQRKSLARGPRIVVIGGGTGQSTILRGLKEHTSNLTAIVAVADDGGSSGVLRAELGIPPVGDIRRCLAALADEENLVGEVLEPRGVAPEGDEVGGRDPTLQQGGEDEAAELAGGSGDGDGRHGGGSFVWVVTVGNPLSRPMLPIGEQAP